MTVGSLVTIKAIRDDSGPEDLDQVETVPNGLTLPLELPVVFPRAGTVRIARDLQRFGQSCREFQFQLTSESGKMVLRSIAASAFLDTVQLQSQ